MEQLTPRHRSPYKSTEPQHWSELALRLYRYEAAGDELRLFTPAGDEFVFRN